METFSDGSGTRYIGESFVKFVTAPDGKIYIEKTATNGAPGGGTVSFLEYYGQVPLDANRTQPPAAPVSQPIQRSIQTKDDLLYGKVIAVSIGDREIRGQPLWWTEPRVITVPDLISAADGSPNGGQLISTGAAAGSTANVIDIAVSFGEPLSTSGGKRDILRIKVGIAGANGTASSSIIYDMTSDPPINAVGLNFTFYDGSETQLPDPTIEEAIGVGLTQAYRGQMYAVFKNFPIDLFTENGVIVIPLFAALIVDEAYNSIVTESFPITTGTPTTSWGTVDWTAQIAYWSGSYRITASRLWGTHAQLYDLPITNFLTSFAHVDNQMAYVDGLRALLTFAYTGSTNDSAFVLIDPRDGFIFAEGAAFAACAAIPHDTAGNSTWSVDTTGASPVYLFANVSEGYFVLEIFSYDPQIGVITSLGETGHYLDGAAGSTFLSSGPLCRGKSEDGQAVFYIGSPVGVHKVVVDLEAAPAYTITTFYAAPAQVHLLHYLPAEDSLVVFMPSGVTKKLRCSDASILWTVTLPFSVPLAAHSSLVQAKVTDGWHRTRNFFGYIVGSTGLYIVDLSDGSATLTANALQPLPHRLTFDSESKAFIDSGSGLDAAIYTLSASGGSSIAFSDIALAFAKRAGYADGRVVVDGISDTFPGALLDRDYAFLDFLSDHRELLNYQVVQDGETIRVVRIPDNPTPDWTITSADCVDPGGARPPITVRQEQETSQASTLIVRYRDPAIDYQFSPQPISRPVSPVPATPSLQTDTIETILIMTADQAVSLGTPILYRRDAGSLKITFNGMPSLSRVKTGDIAVIESGANSYTCIIVQTELGGSLSNQITAQQILTQGGDFARAGDAGSASLPHVVSMPDPASDAIYIDGPLLKARDDLSGRGLAFRWIATSRGQDNWSGAQFVYGFDGVNFVAAAGTALSSQTVQAGAVHGALAAPPWPSMTDWTNSFTVTPLTGDFSTLASVTYSDMMNGLTLAYLGAPGRWEVIGWQTVTANSDGTYTFSGLSRGLYGTDVFTLTHASGDMFIPIPGNSFHNAALPIGDLGDVVYYRAVGITQKLYAAWQEVATVTGNAERPPAPLSLDAVISGSDIALSCARRSRFVKHATDWAFVDSEDVDQWEFDIISGSSIIRTLSSTTPGTTYTAAQITADFGSTPSNLTFAAFRIGHDGGFSVGRGFGTETTIALS
jgi:hypothetical protein